VLGAMVSDGLELLDVLGASTGGTLASATLKAYLKRRIDKGREVLFDQLAGGDILRPQAAAKDEAVAVIYHYFRSACMGTARVNLRLLAQGIAGRLRTSTLVADEFLPHAEALAALSRDEVILLATMYRVKLAHDALVGQGFTRKNDWTECLSELERQHQWSKEHAEATAARCLRSGLVLIASAYGTATFAPSPLMSALCKTIDFADALRREGQAVPE